jgi:hypothetical protein
VPGQRVAIRLYVVILISRCPAGAFLAANLRARVAAGCHSYADRFDEMWLSLSGWSTEYYRCYRMPENKASKIVYETMLREVAAGCNRCRCSPIPDDTSPGVSADARIADCPEAVRKRFSQKKEYPIFIL